MILLLLLVVTLSCVLSFAPKFRAFSAISRLNKVGVSRSHALTLHAKKKKGGGGGGGDSDAGKSGKKSSGGAAAGGEFDWKGYRADIDEKMKNTLDSIGQQLAALRASGANPAMLDRVFVDAYGALTPLNQVASVGTSGASTLTIDPFDKSLVGEIEKAISMSDLNLNPTNDGSGVIRINVPQLTEDRRKELVKKAKAVAEEGKVAIRNHRREGVDFTKKMEKDSKISKDDSKGFQDDLQKMTEDVSKKLETLLKNKETDLLKV